MGSASLGFAGGPAINFRIDPDSVDWNWKMQTSVTPTIGGRVIQVCGATLSDLTISGSFGQSHGDGPDGESWLQAEAFFKKIRDMMEWQSRDATDPGKMQPPGVFTYSPRNWKFAVYVKDLTDPEGGGSVTHTTGKFSYHYSLTLFIVEEMSDALVKAGTSHGVLSAAKAKAIDDYLARINDGIGWHFSQYNGSTDYAGKKYSEPKVPDASGNQPGTTTPSTPPASSGNEPGTTTP
jgi:hypothetical protein